MGLDIVLEDENGGQLASTADPQNHLHRLLPDIADTSFALIRYIDWYGDTVFNRLQMEDFLEEWARLYEKAEADAERKVLREVESLASKCADDLHTYLRFIGD